MSVNNAVTCGLAGNEISKKITGTSEVSAGRTVVAVGAGGATAALTTGAVVVTGVVSAPVVVPIVAASAFIAGVASLFDY